jgi:hypothetical protein
MTGIPLDVPVPRNISSDMPDRRRRQEAGGRRQEAAARRGCDLDHDGDAS